jgi:acyl CoA:acetate/3-ketoacid CoA transferase beta subunit
LTAYEKRELMVIEASRYIKDGEIVLAGIGLPVIASMLAQKTHAPNMTLMVESGVIDPQLKLVPLSIADARVTRKAAMLGSLREVLGCILQRGMVDVGFLGGANLDQYANLNSTVIGDYYKPKIRLPGSGGANPVASLAKKLLIIMPHQRRRFVKKCDYLTSPGYIDGLYGRKNAGLRNWNPSITIVTDLCVMDIDSPGSGQLRLTKLMPDITIDQVIENTGFELIMASRVDVVDLPTESELNLLREIDPEGIYFRDQGT